MTMNNRYHPVYYFEDLDAVAAKNEKLNRQTAEIEALTGRTRRRAAAKHEKKIDADFGSISREDFAHRLAVMGRFSALHLIWGQQGRHVLDLSESSHVGVEDLNSEAPAISADFCPPIYIHFGRDHKLALTKLPGEFVDGVYVVPLRRPDKVGIPPFCLVAACRRGGRLRSTDSLEKLYHNVSTMAVASYEEGELVLIYGEELMEDDPAVMHALRWALREYGNWLTSYGEPMKLLNLMRELPPIDEPWDAWTAVIQDNIASGHAPA